MIDLTKIAKRVKRQFGDESGVQVTDDDIAMWSNDAMREAVIQNNKLNIKHSFAPAIRGQNIVRLPQLESLSAVLSVSHRHPEGKIYIPLVYQTPSDLDKDARGWYSGVDENPFTSVPRFYSFDSTGSISVYPAPSVEDGIGYGVTYNSFFPEVETLLTNYPVAQRYFQYILEYCLMKAYEMDEDWASADRKTQYVQSALNQFQSTDSNAHQTVYPIIGGH
jgi:hypothetical protein